MRYNNLGKSDLKISEITFGCMSLEEDQNKADRLIAKAIDYGVNLFDTADLYQKGYNEEMLGKALLGKRKNTLIATKVGNQLRENGDGWDWNPTKQYIVAAVEKSLSRLQTDYIDLYQLHGGTIEDPIDEIIEAFELLKTQGKIRHYGISSIRPNVIQEYLHKSAISSNMMQYSLLDRRPEESCFQSLKEAQVGVLVRGALAQGTLAGKSRESYLGYSGSEIQQAAALIAKIASDRHVSKALIASMFVFSQTAVSSIVAGIRTEQQIDDFAKLDSVNKLTSSELEELQSVLKPNVYKQHR